MASNLFNNLKNIISPNRSKNSFNPGTFSIGCETDNTNQQTTFFDAFNKISGLQIENKTFDKLKTIVKISNSGKTGTIFGGEDGGVNWVFNQMKWPLPDQFGSIVKSFNPQVVNSAIGAAGQIAEKVKQRNFNFKDIPEVLQDMGNFEALLGGIFTPDNVDKREFEDKCEAINFAMDFAKDYGMKYKFLFVVEFVPNDAYKNIINGKINPAAFVKEFTPPQLVIEHEEVNMYNLRTKIPKYINFQNCNMVFYDDGRNHVMTMMENYLKTMSPVINNDDNLSLEANSQNFGNVKNSSSLRVLDDSSTYAGITSTNDSTQNILKEIRIYHVFFSGHYFNMFTFLNPRFSSITIEPFNMEESAISMISTEFNYDSMYMETNRPFHSDKNRGRIANSSELKTGIKFKGISAPDKKPNENDISNSKTSSDGSIGLETIEASRLVELNNNRVQKNITETLKNTEGVDVTFQNL